MKVLRFLIVAIGIASLRLCSFTSLREKQHQSK